MNISKNLMLEQGYWMHSNRPKVLILSGGSGKRFGMSKALATYQGETFLDLIVSKCLSLNLDIYAVLNAQVNDLIPQNRDYTTIIGDSSQEMYHSILTGIKVIGEFSQLLIWPVDHPFVKVETLKKLLNHSNNEKFIVPSHSGRLGHPILFPKFASSSIDKYHTLKELTKAWGRVIVNVHDEGILTNINKKEDLPENEKLL